MADFDKDGLSNTFIVAVAICLVCSVVVSGIAVATMHTRNHMHFVFIRLKVLHVLLQFEFA